MKQAMVFAAGLGTRLRPLTDTMPKALVPVGGQPLLWHVIRRLREAGVQRVVVNVHHFADQIIDYLKAEGNFGLDICISDERQQLLDTGGAIKQARQFLSADAPVLIHNVDILSTVDLGAVVAEAEALRTAALAISQRESHSGRYLLFDADRHLVGWTNERTGEVRSPHADALDRARLRVPFAGIHAIHPTLFPLMDAWPAAFSIIDFYLQTCKDYAISGHLASFDLLDVGKLDSLTEAENFLNHHPS